MLSKLISAGSFYLSISLPVAFMDQQPVYKLQDFDPDAVDLQKPATTVEEYMRQVHVNRRNCPDIAVANIDPSKIKSIPSSSIIKKEPDIPRICPFAPGKEWQEDFVSF